MGCCALHFAAQCDRTKKRFAARNGPDYGPAANLRARYNN